MPLPQYHFRPSEDGLLAWDVRRLIALSEALPAEAVPFIAMGEMDGSHWCAFEGQVATCRPVLDTVP